MSKVAKCLICPRECNISRDKFLGYCGQNNDIKIALAALHYGEEPCISGKNGSGTIFFTGCSLKCVFCQNYKLSSEYFGSSISVERLSEIFLELQMQGAENINLVTPTHYSLQIIKALDRVKGRLNIPVVYNTGGYEKVETLKLLDDYIDVYLTDIKYFDAKYAEKYSGSENYVKYSLLAAEEMLRQKELVFSENGMLKKGVVIRHLVLPGLRADSLNVLAEIKRRFGTDGFVLSLMSQYTPNNNLENFPEINRKLTTFEYKSVVDKALELGFKYCYMQDTSSACDEYIPAFDLSGVKRKAEIIK